MPRAMRIRIASWPQRALCVLTLVALLVAPGCAPLCTGQNCRRADASATTSGSCHGAGAMTHEALRAHASRSCGSPEMPAVVSTPTPFGEASGEFRLSAPSGKFLAVNQENSPLAAPLFDFYLGRWH